MNAPDYDRIKREITAVDYSISNCQREMSRLKALLTRLPEPEPARPEPKFKIGDKVVHENNQLFNGKILEMEWSYGGNTWGYNTDGIQEGLAFEEYLSLAPEPRHDDGWKVGMKFLTTIGLVEITDIDHENRHMVAGYRHPYRLKSVFRGQVNGWYEKALLQDGKRVLSLHLAGEPLGPGRWVRTPEGWVGMIITKDTRKGEFHVFHFKANCWATYAEADLTSCEEVSH